MSWHIFDVGGLLQEAVSLENGGEATLSKAKLERDQKDSEWMKRGECASCCGCRNAHLILHLSLDHGDDNDDHDVADGGDDDDDGGGDDGDDDGGGGDD